MTTSADSTQRKGAPPGTPAKRSRLSFPLPAKILVCFVANLALLAGVAVYVAQGQFRFGLDSLLTGSSGERIQVLSSLVVSALEGHKRSDWPAILQRIADISHVQIAAVLNDGTRLAGTIMDPPAAVLTKLADGNADPFDRPPGPRPPRVGGGDGFPPGPVRGGPPRGNPPRDLQPDGQSRRIPPRPGPNGDFPQMRDDGPPDFRDGRPPSPDFPPPDGPPPPSPGGPNGLPKFIVHAGKPAMYWIGVRTPLPTDTGRPGPPTTLLIAVPSLATGGLLLDVSPWLWVGAGVLVCSVLLWLPLVRGITRSIGQMTGAAGQMAQGQFGTRVDTARRDELGRLGESLNHMAGRLGEYVTGQKRFLGDIAHELCSPLARMEMALGVLEQRAAAEQIDHVNDVREEVRHMSSLVNELLSFSKAGLRAKELELRPVPLAELCRRVIAREAEGKADISVSVDAALKVLGDPDLLARAVGNVLRNAVRYAGDAGPIVLIATARGADVTLAITDSGPGVPPETLHRLFDPFYRPESARTREGGGSGLGLAIVKSCMEACGGSVTVRNVKPSGLEVGMVMSRAA
ncbi:MAG: HAMP domain-containing sensor histidine kinase [Chthoniobacteraceae bacterium]